MADTVPVKFVDNPFAPEVLTTACTGFFLLNGNITLTFESARVDHTVSPGPVNRVVVGRLTMPIVCAQNLVLGLNDYLENHGLSPTKAATGEATPQ